MKQNMRKPVKRPSTNTGETVQWRIKANKSTKNKTKIPQCFRETVRTIEVLNNSNSSEYFKLVWMKE